MMNEDRRRFRVWYCDQEVSIFDGTEVIINQNGDIRALHHNNNAPDEWCDTTDLDVEACTGLRDKNGQLIYEGDIIEYEKGLSGEVVFMMGTFLVKRFIGFGEYSYVPMHRMNFKLFEIVGNIHEDTESLKDEKC